MTSRPNILCIMSDEHDAAVTGCYGDPLVQTPHLDALAARGTVFESCYCNSPLCVPSRLSFTSGRYISDVSAWNNACRLPRDMPSLPRVLRKAGYSPYLCGKQHYAPDRRYGFIDLLPEMNQNKKSGRGGRRPADSENINRMAWWGRAADFHVHNDSGIIRHDRKVTQTACNFLRDWQAEQGPFFLFAGYLAPHFPLIAPEEHYSKYRGKTPAPNIPDNYLNTMPTNYRQQRLGFGSVLADDETIQRGRDLYWALTDWFDGQVGELLASLDNSSVADDTIVIYTSDHGENKGDHGMWWKNCLYDHGARVPLIVSWPKRWAGGQRRTQVCSLVDLVASIAAWGGGCIEQDWRGDDLTPLLEDANAKWKDQAISQYYGHNIASGITMLRQGKWKYVYHARMDEQHGPEYELYDMEADPLERHNLATNSEQAERLQAMHRAMVAELGDEPDAIETRCRAETAVGYSD